MPEKPSPPSYIRRIFRRESAHRFETAAQLAQAIKILGYDELAMSPSGVWRGVLRHLELKGGLLRVAETYDAFNLLIQNKLAESGSFEAKGRLQLRSLSASSAVAHCSESAANGG